jgi:hypothetical protein
MVPQYFAAPNTALNSSINRGNALTKKLATLGIIVTGLEISPVGSPPGSVPLDGVSIPDAEALGVGPDDLVHLIFNYVGSEGIQPAVAMAEQLLTPATVSAIIALFGSLFPALSNPQAESRALAALAALASVAAALQSIFSIRKNTRSNTKHPQMRHLFGGVLWGGRHRPPQSPPIPPASRRNSGLQYAGK